MCVREREREIERECVCERERVRYCFLLEVSQDSVAGNHFVRTFARAILSDLTQSDQTQTSRKVLECTRT